MDDVHVKLEFGEAVNSKRQLLSSEVNLLNIAKKLQAYKKLRKQELTVKSKIRTSAKKIAAGIRKLKHTLPKTKSPERVKRKAKIAIIKLEKKGRIETELKEINERLERLNA